MANGDNIFGETSGVDLTAVVNPINLNPLDIFGKDYSEKLKTIDTWNRFQSWLRISASSILISQGILSPGQVILNNPILNSRAKGKPISDRIIDNYNITNPQYPITLVDIQNIQLFHQKVNPRVQVDEWVGSQTTQLSYPSPTTYAVTNNFNPPKDYRAKTLNNKPATLPYFPIIWGNKRFIISRENWDKGVKNEPLGSKIWIQKYLDPNYFILYNNNPIYENKIEFGNYPAKLPWNSDFFKGPTITQSPNQVNQQTQQQQQNNNKSKQGIQVVTNITQSPK